MVMTPFRREHQQNAEQKERDGQRCRPDVFLLMPFVDQIAARDVKEITLTTMLAPMAQKKLTSSMMTLCFAPSQHRLFFADGLDRDFRGIVYGNAVHPFEKALDSTEGFP